QEKQGSDHQASRLPGGECSRKSRNQRYSYQSGLRENTFGRVIGPQYGQRRNKAHINEREHREQYRNDRPDGNAHHQRLPRHGKRHFERNQIDNKQEKDLLNSNDEKSSNHTTEQTNTDR